MISIKVRGIDDVRRSLAGLSADVERKVLPPALNRTAEKARTEMTRAITDEFAIKPGDVRPRLQIFRANKANPTVILHPFGSRRKGRSLNLIRFLEKKTTLAQARKRAKSGTLQQLHFQIRKGSGLKRINGSFVATANGGTAVFRRKGRDRYPIEAVSTIDVPSMFNTRRINSRVVARIRRDLPIEVERAITAVLSGSLGKRR